MRRLILTVTVVLACEPAEQLASDDETTGEPGTTGATANTGAQSSGSTTDDTSSTGNSEHGTSSASTSGWTSETSGSEASSGDESGSTGSTGSTETGEPCQPGSHGCECFNGACVGDLVCGEGDRCFDLGECQGVDGTEGCACVGDSCFGDLQCWQGTCVSECMVDPDNNDAHCGGICGNACGSSFGFGGCQGGECRPYPGGCFAKSQYSSCAEYCQSIGASCVEKGCGGVTSWHYDTPQDCDDAVTVGDDATSSELGCAGLNFDGAYRCCCA